MFIELHMIQNFAPSNLNRDDTGSPKDCEFGGTRRARISSQCLKRAMREAPIFKEETGVEPAHRTKLLVQKMVELMFGKLGKDEEPTDDRTRAESLLRTFAEAIYSGTKNEQSNVLLFISTQERDDIIKIVQRTMDEIDDEEEQKTAVVRDAKAFAKQLRKRTSAPDIALFGRMLAEHPDLNIDAASQVAHAISTHRVNMEMDYYTAVDELKKELQPEGKEDKGGSGSAMLGFTGYNSACFYRYSRLDWDQLLQNLGGDVSLARKTVKAFIHAAHNAIPTGKQNSHAAFNPPSLMFAVARSGGMAWSLANAFETPVRSGRETGYVTPSVEKLDAQWKRFTKVYGDETIAAAVLFSSQDDLSLNSLKSNAVDGLNDCIKTIVEALPTEGAA